MDALICPCCGAADLKMENGFLVCQYCGSHIMPTAEEQRKYRLNSSSAANFATAQSDIALSDDIIRLLGKCKSDPKHAKKYANLILDIDPDNEEALKYL